MDTNNLFFNPLHVGMPTDIPDTAITRNDYTANVQDRRTELQRKQVMNGSAWLPGGYLYNQNNPNAIAVRHGSGLFNVYVDPPKEITKPVDAIADQPVAKLGKIEVSRKSESFLQKQRRLATEKTNEQGSAEQ